MERFDTYSRMLADLGVTLQPQTRLLDFGCGAGGLVKAAYQRGLDAYGCDIDFGSEWLDQQVLAEMRVARRVLPIETPYRLPFEDAFFDVVISDQVFEHVLDYDQAIAEIRRVMKPGAAFLHIFPPRYAPLEGHLFVPLANFFHPRWWFKLWASLGVRNKFQVGMSADETADFNVNFMRTMTNYLPPGTVEQKFSQGFRLRFAEGQFMKVSARARVFIFPFLYRMFYQRCMFGIKV